MIVDLPDLASMDVLGKKIATALREGDVVSLSGDLGTGKTTLARAIIAASGHSGDVPSPTFTIVETYDDCVPRIIHADFYRLKGAEDAAELGLADYRAGAALIAEWPEQAGGFAHEPNCLNIQLRAEGRGRQAIVEPGSAWLGRWP